MQHVECMRSYAYAPNAKRPPPSAESCAPSIRWRVRKTLQRGAALRWVRKYLKLLTTAVHAHQTQSSPPPHVSALTPRWDKSTAMGRGAALRWAALRWVRVHNYCSSRSTHALNMLHAFQKDMLRNKHKTSRTMGVETGLRQLRSDL